MSSKSKRDAATSLGRRQWLAGSAGALATMGLGAANGQAHAQAQSAASAPALPVAPAKPLLPAYAAWKDAGAVIIHSSSTIETKRQAFGNGLITPAEQLYVRNNLPAPSVSILENRDAWEISIEGVKQPRVLSLRELKTMGLETTPMVLQCSGNGRGFFPNKPSGTPWTVGAAGCVVWTGVSVRQLVESLGGTLAGMDFMTGTGGELLPEGLDPKSIMVERSVPAKAMADALLAWEMNGVPIPLAHGGPLRLIVPGYQGVNQIKYVKRLAFTAQESDAKIMAHGYRISPPGAKADPSQPSVLEMNVKSWITSPLPERAAAAGQVQIQGLGFGGQRAVKRVEVSVDAGKTWKEARLVGPDLGKYAWRQFVLAAKLPAGTHTLMSRAIDTAGNVQPEQRLENVGGYNNNSVLDHAVTVTLA
ncbi:sulfite oxidase [Paucibacter sp. TC2R-5]|uniref:SorT family sulfite dehydrogenase catalytic subunit n=1 Tax=Paucibacter sp. TC2R-5 TaxID=2893555 RepID=UPI0021E45EE9|nr:sulfite oxidase [Paucibacter sp. TC2R-5]MCV2360972.1 sulfite oxidase [Paucibacter sp. TC2R-5]